jgi:hypothetical protein
MRSSLEGRKQVVLEVNTEKSKCISYVYVPQPKSIKYNLVIGNQSLEIVPRFRYIGKELNQNFICKIK